MITPRVRAWVQIKKKKSYFNVLESPLTTSGRLPAVYLSDHNRQSVSCCDRNRDVTAVLRVVNFYERSTAKRKPNQTRRERWTTSRPALFMWTVRRNEPRYCLPTTPLNDRRGTPGRAGAEQRFANVKTNMAVVS